MNENWLISKLRSLHSNQSGAVAFMVLCAILISLLMALVVWDTTPAARQKIEVQTAADTAAWSQSAVEARSMNMIAFANIAKRIIMGQALFYSMLWLAWFEILALTIAALIIAIVACFFGVGCAFVDKLVITLANVVIVMAQEATDGASFLAEILPRAREDVQALDRYQVHFQNLTPWWSWGEGWRRGLRNGAYVSGWPVPDNATGFASSLPAGIGTLLTTGLEDALPIERYPSYGELCVRSLLPDLPVHLLDYAAQTLLCGSDCTQDTPSGGIPRAALYIAAGVLAAAQYAGNCAVEFVAGVGVMSLSFTDAFHPFQLQDPGEAEWYRMTSNLVFAYRPGADFNGEFRDRYGYMSRDYEAGLSALYEPNGFLGMARAEVSYQNGDPDMWHPSYSVRMRPVALPGEWGAYGGDYRMLSAFNDTVPYLLAGATIGGALDFMGVSGFGGGDKMGLPDPWDLLKAEVAFDAMTDSYVDGVAR